MTCSGLDILNPFTWILFAGIASGAAVSVFLRPGKSGYNWVFVCFSLSGAVIFSLLGLFLPGAVKILDKRLLYWFAGAVLIGTLGFRFRKSIGLPLLFLTSLVILFFFIGTYPLTCFSNNEPVFTFEVLRSGESYVIVEKQNDDSKALYLEIPGTSISAELGMMYTEDYYFFIKNRYAYTAPKFYPASERTGKPETPQDRFSRSFVQWIAKNQDILPGIRFETLTSGQKNIRLYRTYSIVIAGMNGAFQVRIVPVLP